MALNINNTVEIVSNRHFFTLRELREFIKSTETWADETKVFPGTDNKSWSRLISEFGDVTGNH